jgi:hypothetical protein
MIIRVKQRAMVVLAVAFVACVLVLGLPNWTLSYSELNQHNPMYGWGLAVLFVFAAVIRGAGLAGFLSTWATMAAVLPVITMTRVVYDTAIDPTSHNLWPFELVIAVVVGMAVTLVGAFAGTLLARPRRKRSQPDTDSGPREN